MDELQNERGQTLAEFLAVYDAGKYPRPSVTVDMAVFTLHEGKLCALLIKRKDHPCIGRWALPGGFLNMDESLWQAAARELEEETGVAGLLCRQFYTFGDLERDPRTRVVTVAYIALAPGGTINPSAGDDAADAALFCIEVETCAQDEIAFFLCGPERLMVKARIIQDALGMDIAPCIDAGGLGIPAFDHAYVLARALHALNALPREKACALLADGDATLYVQAYHALEKIEQLFNKCEGK